MVRPREIRHLIEKITFDRSKSIEERIDEVFDMRQHLDVKDDKERLRNDVDYYDCMIRMIENEDTERVEDLARLQLYALLAETYTELEDYRPIYKLAQEVLEMIRHEDVAWEAMAETLPRIIDAVAETVYHHAEYEQLLIYILMAFKTGNLTDEFKGRVRKWMKLHLLLEESDWLDFRLTKELERAMADMFTQTELFKIMLDPKIGHLRTDPVEYTWEWEKIYYDVEAELDRRLANVPRQMGFCFQYWAMKRELLMEKYGIDWRSPSQMNPRVMFD
jgi:hypothetical protein